ncbi:MAG: isocitrate lyase/PEP mutase family protein [Acidobacteriota bacterium]|nr:isocitrate lyase/PEP mutase family protein [Acidobacteriota bacterium]
MSRSTQGDLHKESSRRRFLQGTGMAASGLVAHALGGETAVAAQPSESSSPGSRFRRLLERSEPSRCVNCGDVATARLVEMHGFEIVLTGGSALSLSKFGLGDYGMATIDDLVEFCSRTAEAIQLPIIADADDGGGNPLNVYRSVQRYERAGAACVMIEDLYGAKHLRGLSEGKILSADAMVDKIHAATDARQNSDTVIMTRCDIIAAGGTIEAALERVTRYAQEGGDVIFVPSIPLDQCSRAVAAAQRPMMFGAPSVQAARDNRISIAFFGGINVLALGAVDRALGELAQDGQLGRTAEITLDPNRRWELIRNDEMVELAKQYNAQREDAQ